MEDRIIKDGRVREGGILKVDNFLNHQIDVSFLNEAGKAFYDHFRDRNINKILTVEASGIGIAIEKGFQGGGDVLRTQGYDVFSLAVIDEMSDEGIKFR